MVMTNPRSGRIATSTWASATRRPSASVRPLASDLTRAFWTVPMLLLIILVPASIIPPGDAAFVSVVHHRGDGGVESSTTLRRHRRPAVPSSPGAGAFACDRSLFLPRRRPLSLTPRSRLQRRLRFRSLELHSKEEDTDQDGRPREPDPSSSSSYSYSERANGAAGAPYNGDLGEEVDVASSGAGLNGDADSSSSTVKEVVSTAEEATAGKGEHEFDLKRVMSQLTDFREMAYPYFEESKKGRWLFAGMIGLTLLNSGVSVAFSYVGRDFWSALSSKEAAQFWAMMVKFSAALIVGAPVAVMYRFQRERLAVEWREWMTDRTLQLYSSNRVYYALERGAEIDNPDQRIAEDVRTFTAYSLQLFITVVTAVIDLVSFSFILYSIQPSLFGAIIAYAAFGTVTTTALGRKLVGLNFDRLQKEANFRYSLVRIRDNAESIAFYAGEDIEGKEISDRLNRVVDNKRQINAAQRNLEFFTTAYHYLVQVLPVSVVAPQYFAGTIELGVVSQTSGAFNHILNDLSVIVNQFESLSAFSAGIDRLSQFMRAIRDSDPERADASELMSLPNATKTSADASSGVETYDGVGESSESLVSSVESSPHVGGDVEASTISLHQMPPMSFEQFASPADGARNCMLSIKNLSLTTPDRKRRLISNLNLTLPQGESLLIVGNSGAGKSSLLRAIAGLWTAGSGSIDRPSDTDVYFLPQRPYCVLGTLKDQLLYPSLEEMNPDDYPEGHRLSRAHLLRQSLSDDDLLKIFDAVSLSELPERAGDGDPIKGLGKVMDWSNTLSLGEQQRLAFGRLLVNRPRLVILDEATSALDMEAEAKMYDLLRSMAEGDSHNGSGVTYVSVGHRPSLLKYHDLRLRLSGESDHMLEHIDKARIGQESSVVIENM